MFHEAASPSRRWSSNSLPLQLRSKLSSVHQLTSSQAHARSIPASQVDERSVYPHDGARAHRAARGVAPRPSCRLLAHPSRLRRTSAARLESRRSTVAPTEGTIPNSGTLPHVPPGSLVSIYCQLGRPTTRHACDLYPRVTRLPAVGLALVETLDACLDRLI